MALTSCPKCSVDLRLPLPSGRQVCTGCGWSNTAATTVVPASPQVRDIGFEALDKVKSFAGKAIERSQGTLDETLPINNSFDEKRQNFGYIGAGMLFVGCFCPLISMPLGASVTYFNSGRGDGIFIVVLSLLTFAITYKKSFKWLWATGLSSLGLLLFALYNFMALINTAKDSMESTLAGNPFRGFADLAVQSVQIQWGWALLILGSLIVLVAAIMKPPQTT
jgi:hypothetical protein